MKKLTKIIAFAMIASAPLAMTSIANADSMEAHKETMMKKETTTTTLVAYHADWCGGCKILGEKMEKVMNGLDEETKSKLSMVKFDFTDETSKAATKTLAEKKGVSSLYPQDKAKTGIVKVVDSASNDVLGRIHYKMSEEEITGLLKGIAARS